MTSNLSTLFPSDCLRVNANHQHAVALVRIRGISRLADAGTLCRRARLDQIWSRDRGKKATQPLVSTHIRCADLRAEFGSTTQVSAGPTITRNSSLMALPSPSMYSGCADDSDEGSFRSSFKVAKPATCSGFGAARRPACLATQSPPFGPVQAC